MIKIKVNIYIDYDNTQKILAALNWRDDMPENLRLDGNDVIVNTALFPDGKKMDIKCCGVNYIDGECNSAWTEAVLFDEHGCEIGCTDVSEEYFGEWTINHDGITYTTIVNRRGKKKDEK